MPYVAWIRRQLRDSLYHLKYKQQTPNQDIHAHHLDNRYMGKQPKQDIYAAWVTSKP